MRRAAKVDETHAGIRDALRKAGCSVFSCASVGGGVPDLVVGYRGFTALVECKTGSRAINERQSAFMNDWQGRAIVARTPEQAVSEFFTEWATDRLSKV